ncbi:MAG: phasin family protein [Alphaproteobacteria bacterium]|nr:phasin family protein [Alphaproteobacteria bacterium]
MAQNKSQNPFEDFFKTFQDIASSGFPSFDPSELSKAGQSNMKLMQDVAQVSSGTLQKMLARQQEMTTQAVQDWQKSLEEVMTSNPDKMMQRSTELTRKNAEAIARNFAELAKMSQDAQTEIFDLLRSQANGDSKKS